MFDSATQTSNSSVPGTSSGGLHTFGLAANSREREEAAPASGVFERPRRLPPTNAEFKVLYDAHFRLVWCALTRLGVRDADLMDLTQKVFLIAFLKLPEFEGRSLLSTWLWGICRRVAIAHRRSGPMRYEVATDPIEFEVAFEQRAGTQTEPNSTRQVAVEHMLSKLSESQRIVFRLSEVDDLDGPQIATLLNISLGTVRSRLRYARQRIRREVKRLTVANAFAQRTGK
jgi:RNA polymerase sigma-70 factor (ECF subfamily)